MHAILSIQYSDGCVLQLVISGNRFPMETFSPEQLGLSTVRDAEGLKGLEQHGMSKKCTVSHRECWKKQPGWL